LGKTLVIGNATGYTWDQVKYWVNSLKKTGFAGDIALCVSNVTAETIRKLEEEGVMPFAYGTKNADGSYSLPNDGTVPHVVRFFYMWLVLDKLSGYDQVISTDVRDVVFQRDPTLDMPEAYNLAVSSEGMLYKNEPWGNRNILEGYGPFFHNILKDKEILNVGVIGGRYESVKNLFLNIFLMSINRPIPVVDQASYNMLIHLMYNRDDVWFNPSDWAIQLGTTPQAVLEGNAGDLALNIKLGHINADDYRESYFGPLFNSYSGRVRNLANMEEFAIVHQWDRVPKLTDVVKVLYNA
jgi:hypothetical protein